MSTLVKGQHPCCPVCNHVFEEPIEYYALYEKDAVSEDQCDECHVDYTVTNLDNTCKMFQINFNKPEEE